MAVDIRLRVGDTSAQDVSLTSSGVAVLENYPMGTPELEQTAIQFLGDGGGLSVPSWSNVTETIPLHISAASDELVADKIRAIERLLDLARQGSIGHLDDRLYLRLQFDHDTEAWRSQILAARLEVATVSNQIWRNFARADLIITRRYYWETEAMKSVAVSSGTTTTATTGYATVYNSDDTHATQRNWFQIAADQVIGSIPAPAKIYIKNISGASRSLAAVHLGNYVYADPTNVDPIFRSEDAAFTDTTPGTTEQDVYNWSLASNGLCDDFRGQFGRFLVVWSNNPAIDTLVRAALRFGSAGPNVDLALGEQMLNTTSETVTDLGALPIPPSSFTAGFGTNVYLAVRAKAASGTDTLGIDWLQIMPSGAGKYRVVKGISTLTMSVDGEIIDDGPNGTVYGYLSGTPYPTVRPLFSPIHLWPGKVQRLRMIIAGGPLSMEAGQAWAVKIEYKPRRLSF